MTLRPALDFVSKKFKKKNLTGMEIGIYKGDHARQIFEEMPQVKTLYLVDPYVEYDEYLDYRNEKMVDIERLAHEKLDKYSKRSIWIKKFFDDTIAKNLDFVYIDGNHQYNFVYKDIINAVRSTKKDGIIAGHDYYNQDTVQVSLAVDQFCEKHKISFSSAETDWWFINPFTHEQAMELEFEPLIQNFMPLVKGTKVCGLSVVYNDEGCLPTFFAKLDRLTYHLAYHIFVTNNCTDKTDELIDEYLKTHPGKRVSYNMHKDFVIKMKDPYSAIAVASQVGLKDARRLFEWDKNFTHVLFLDSDIYIDTPDAIERAVARDVHILAGPYLRDFPTGRHLAGVFFVDDQVVKLLPQYESSRGQYFYFDNIFFDLIKVPFMSNGFCLYSRKIVMDKRVNFWPIFKTGPDYVHHDECSPEFGYQNRAAFLGYYTWLDGTIKLSHYIGYRHRAHRGDGKSYVEFQYDK